MILQSNHKEYLHFTNIIYSQRSQSFKSQSTDDQIDVKYCSNKKKINSKIIPNIFKTKQVDSKIKYKTQMCKNFSQMGYCNYRNKCQYAHGYNELANVPIMANKSYRTKKCKSFWEKGVCFYGTRCQFSHYEIKSETKLFLRIVLQNLRDEQNLGKVSRLQKLLSGDFN